MRQGVSEELEILRAVIEPLRIICDEICNRLPAIKVHCIVCEGTSASSRGATPIYTMYPVYTGPREVDAEVSMPMDLHESIRYAIPKLNMCDYVCAVFLPHLANALENINARVDWLIVELQPHFLLRFVGYQLPEHQAHSIFSITTSSGEQFMADFTMEQFGFHPRYWLSSKSDYIDCYTVNCEYRLHTDEEKTAMKSYADYDSLAVNLQRATDALVGAFDRQAYNQLPMASRRPWIRAAVRDTFARLGIPTSQD